LAYLNRLENTAYRQLSTIWHRMSECEALTEYAENAPDQKTKEKHPHKIYFEITSNMNMDHFSDLKII